MTLCDQTVEELISEAQEDEVGLWLIVEKVKDELGLQDDQAIKQATLDGVARLLRTGKVVAGSYRLDRTGVERWTGSIPEVIERISREWDALGREPNIGEIAVLIAA
jgi:hypothetical protein